MPPLPRFSCYNTALSYKGDDASYAERPHPPPAAAADGMSLLHSMSRPPEFAHYTKYGGMEERTEYRLFVSGDLRIFHSSREMEIFLRESSRKNLARIL